jgi:hypothetical protein
MQRLREGCDRVVSTHPQALMYSLDGVGLAGEPNMEFIRMNDSTQQVSGAKRTRKTVSQLKDASKRLKPPVVFEGRAGTITAARVLLVCWKSKLLNRQSQLLCLYHGCVRH